MQIRAYDFPMNSGGTIENRQGQGVVEIESIFGNETYIREEKIDTFFDSIQNLKIGEKHILKIANLQIKLDESQVQNLFTKIFLMLDPEFREKFLKDMVEGGNYL